MLLTAATVGWIGEGNTSAAAPAELISAAPGGAPLASSDYLASVSGDGNIVVFTAVPQASLAFVGNVQVAVRDRAAGTTTTVPAPFLVDRTTNGVVSRDGCRVAFWGYFVGFNVGLFSIPARWSIYTWNRCTPAAAPVFVSNAGGILPASTDPVGALAISADGRYVAYTAVNASLGSRVARVDTNPPITAASEALLQAGFFNPNSIDISDDGAFLAIGGQTTIDDRTRNVVEGWYPPCGITVGSEFPTCATELISVGNTGLNNSEINRNPSVSADGRYVAFTSNRPDIVGAAALTTRQVYVQDRGTGVTRLVSTSPGQLMSGEVDDPEISPDGTQIALVHAGAPAPGAKPVGQVFVARSLSGFFDSATFDLVSYGVSDAPTSTDSFMPSMSSNGRYVAFSSAANLELSGVTMPNTLNVWMRQRPIALDITPALDFGTVTPGGQSAPQNAVVTNTSGISINIGAVTPPAAPFSITANGCGGPLGPGASCAITVVFSPTAPGGASSTVGVSGDGLSVSASLLGNGLAPPLPTPGSLVIAPGSADYGSGTVGTSVAPKRFTVSNPGQTAVPLAGSGISGTGADQFAITGNTCGASLGPGASCSIDVGATIAREGASSATLGVLGSGGESASAILRITGNVVTVQVFTPTLKMNPGVVSPGEVTVAIGEGFPPNIAVELAFFGEFPFATVQTDAAGAFRFDFLVLRNGVRIGGLQVTALDQPQFTGVRAPLLIDLATFRPAGFSNPAFTVGVRSMVSRGG